MNAADDWDDVTPSDAVCAARECARLLAEGGRPSDVVLRLVTPPPPEPVEPGSRPCTPPPRTGQRVVVPRAPRPVDPGTCTPRWDWGTDPDYSQDDRSTVRVCAPRREGAAWRAPRPEPRIYSIVRRVRRALRRIASRLRRLVATRWRRTQSSSGCSRTWRGLKD